MTDQSDQESAFITVTQCLPQDQSVCHLLKNCKKWKRLLRKLKQKHAASYDIEKLNGWAHLHMGKHETPPNLPYFGKGGGGMKDKRKSQKTRPVDQVNA